MIKLFDKLLSTTAGKGYKLFIKLKALPDRLPRGPANDFQQTLQKLG